MSIFFPEKIETKGINFENAKSLAPQKLVHITRPISNTLQKFSRNSKTNFLLRMSIYNYFTGTVKGNSLTEG